MHACRSTLEDPTEDLIRIAQNALNPEAPVEVSVGEMVRKIRGGLPLHMALEHIGTAIASVAKEWPLVVPVYAPGADPLEHVVRCLTAEAIGKAKDLGPLQRALLASTCAGAFLLINEVALAEQALLRGRDHLQRVTPDDPMREMAAQAIAEQARSIHMELDLDPIDVTADQISDLPQLAARHLRSNQALMLFELGRIGEAIVALDASRADNEAWLREIRDGVERAQVESLVSGDLANLAAALDALPEATQSDLVTAWPVLARMFPDGITTAALLHAVGKLLVEALALSERCKNDGFAAIQAHRLMGVEARLGRSAEAKAYGLRAIDHAQRVGDHTRAWTARAYLSKLAQDEGDGRAALEQLEGAAREWLHESIGRGRHAERGDAPRSLADAALRAVAVGGDAGRAIMIAETLKGGQLGAALASGIPGGDRDGTTGAHVAQLRHLIRQREVLRMTDPIDRAALATIGEQIDRARAELQLRDPGFAPWIDATDIEIASVASFLARLEQLGTGATLIGFLLAGERCWTYALWSDGAIVESCGIANIREGVAHGGADSEDRGGLPQLETPRVTVAPSVLAPLARRLRELAPEQPIVISACDGLWDVPFAAARVDGRMLCEIATLSFTHGVDELEACLSRGSRTLERIVCIGDPTRADARPLRGARAEATRIAAVFGDAGKTADVLVGDDATVGALEERARDLDAIHFACHASRGADRRARLMLARGDLSEDRILYDLRLPRGCLVTLAACATNEHGDPDVPLHGGLVPAFLLAGASCVIATLWPIADGPAATFQAELYRRLLATGGRPAAALASTQRDALAGNLGAELRSTEVWSAYVAWGGR